jgi:hypothetical protein
MRQAVLSRLLPGSLPALPAGELSSERRSLRIPEFESRHPGILNSPVVMVRQRLHRGCLPKSLPQLHIRNTQLTRERSLLRSSANSLKTLWRSRADGFEPPSEH